MRYKLKDPLRSKIAAMFLSAKALGRSLRRIAENGVVAHNGPDRHARCHGELPVIALKPLRGVPYCGISVADELTHYGLFSNGLALVKAERIGDH